MKREEVSIGEWYWTEEWNCAESMSPAFVVRERSEFQGYQDELFAQCMCDADANKICREHNSHDPLLQACRTVWSRWKDSVNATDPEADGYEDLQMVKAALEKAGAL